MKKSLFYSLREILFAGALLYGHAALDAADVVWDNGSGDNDFGNTANWTGGVLPVVGDQAIVNMVGTDRMIYSSGANADFNAIYLGVASEGEFEMTGGDLLVTGHSGRHTRVGVAGGTAVINQSGGSAKINVIQIALDSASTGTYNLTGGDLNISREKSGGSLFIGNPGTGRFEMSGGSLITRAGVHVAPNGGVGTFSVVGSGPTNIGIGSSGSIDGSWIQEPKGILEVTIDDGGLTKILIDDVDNDGAGGNVTFKSGALLDVEVDGDLVEGSWVVMEWEGELTDSSLALAADDAAAGWNIAFEDRGINGDVAGPDSLVLSYQLPVAGENLVVEADETLAVEIITGDLGSVSVDGVKGVLGIVGNAIFAEGAVLELNVNGIPQDGTWVIAEWQGLLFDNGLVLDADSEEEGWSIQYEDNGVNSEGVDTLILQYVARQVREFVHPGILHTEGSFEHMRFQLDNRMEPAYGSFLLLEASTYASSSYSMNGPYEEIGRGDGPFNSQSRSDFIAAYQNALMWKLTDDEAHAEKAMEILNGYANTLQVINTVKDAPLLVGLRGFLLANAAEIMRDYSGMSEEKLSKLATMFKEIFLPVCYDFFNRSPYSNGNWGAAVSKGAMSYAIFCDDQELYEFATDWYLNGHDNGVLKHYVDDIDGQNQEAGRDQQHVMLGLANLAEGAEVAYNQGDDLYGGYDGDSRLLGGFEYVAQYNLGHEVPYYTWTDLSGKYSKWGVISEEGRGTFRPIFDMVYNHYVKRERLSMPWTEEVLSATRPEGQAFYADHPGYGSLLFSHNEGVPQYEIPWLPMRIEAEEFDYYTKDSGGGEGFTYHDSDDTNSGGDYRLEDAVDIEVCSEGGFDVTDMQAEEWILYTLYAPLSGTYDISVRYSAVAGDGAIRFSLDGNDLTSDVVLPATGSDTSWSRFVVAEDVLIEKGLGELTLYVAGASGAYSLNYIDIELKEESDNPVRYEAEAFDRSGGVIVVDTDDVDGVSHLDGIEGGQWSQYDDVFLGVGSQIQFRIARPEGAPDGRIEVRKGDVRGELLASLEVPVTGGWDQWETIETEMNVNAGIENLALVFFQEGSASAVPMFNLNWFSIRVLDVPGDVRADHYDENQAVIAWGLSAGATEYEIRRSNSQDGVYEVVGTVPSTLRSFTDTGLDAGGSYYYVVNSIHGDFEGVGSPVLRVVPSALLNEDESEVNLVLGAEGDVLVFNIPNTVIGHRYDVVKTDDLTLPEWEIASEVVIGTGGRVEVEVAIDSISSGIFYQLRVERL